MLVQRQEGNLGSADRQEVLTVIAKESSKGVDKRIMKADIGTKGLIVWVMGFELVVAFDGAHFYMGQPFKLNGCGSWLIGIER